MAQDEKQQSGGYISDDIINTGKAISNINKLNNTSNALSSMSTKASSLAENGIKDGLKEGTKEIAKEGAKKGVETAVKATVETVSASTGVGTVAVTIQKGIKLAGKGLSFITQQEHDKHWYIYLLIVLFLFVSYVNIILCSWHGNVGASSELYHEDQYGKYYSKENTEKPLSIIGLLHNFFSKFIDGGEEVGDYNAYHPLTESLDNNIAIINKAFTKAYEMSQKETEAIIIDREYDYELTMESFFSNSYPYDNINYAELLSIISEKDIYNAENIKFSNFKILFKNSLDNTKLQYLYCINIEDAYKTVRYYINQTGNEVRLKDNESAPDGISVSEKELKYGEVILVKYDLKSLYQMIDLQPNEKNKHYKSVNNVDMIDSQEETLRFASVDYNLGPKTRTVWDCGIGRSGITVAYQDYLDYIEYINLYSGDISDAEKLLLETAISKLGTVYSQSLRNKEGYFDCSSFCSWVYRESLGIEFGSYSPTAAEMCRYLESTDHKVSSNYSDNLEVGDLIFYSSKDNGRYNNVTHVAMYAGNGKIVDASYSKGKVVYRNIWGKNQIVSVCRPLD